MPEKGPQGDTKELSFRISVSEWMELDRIAMEESEPGDRTSVSDVGRDAVRKYLEEDDHPDVENRDVRNRGHLRNGIKGGGD